MFFMDFENIFSFLNNEDISEELIAYNSTYIFIIHVLHICKIHSSFADKTITRYSSVPYSDMNCSSSSSNCFAAPKSVSLYTDLKTQEISWTINKGSNIYFQFSQVFHVWMIGALLSQDILITCVSGNDLSFSVLWVVMFTVWTVFYI